MPQVGDTDGHGTLEMIDEPATRVTHFRRRIVGTCGQSSDERDGGDQQRARRETTRNEHGYTPFREQHEGAPYEATVIRSY